MELVREGAAGDRQVKTKNESHLGGTRYDSVFVNFVNLPKGYGHGGGGAEGENNRMTFWVEGFGRDSPDAPPPTGKVKVEMRTSAMPRALNMRAKTGTPEKIAEYLASYLNKIAAEVEPRYTHGR